MRQARLFLLLLTPSISSLATGIALAGTLIGATAWHQLDNYAVVQEYLSVRRTVPHGFDSFLTALFTNSATYNVALFVAAAAVTAMVYVALQFLNHGLAGMLETMSLARVRQSDQKDAKRRYGVRTLALVIWVLYLMVTFKSLLPACLLAARLAINSHSWATLVYVWLFLVLAFQIHVVLARLVNLRPRLYGGGDALIAAQVS